MSHIGHRDRLDAVCALTTPGCLFVADSTDKGVQCALRTLIKNKRLVDKRLVTT